MKTNESWCSPSAACVYLKNEYRGSVAEMQAAKPSALVELIPASAMSSPGLILYLPVSAFHFLISHLFRIIPAVPNCNLNEHLWAPPKRLVHGPQFLNSVHSQNASSFPPFQLGFVPPPPWPLLASPLPLSMEPPAFYFVHASPILAVRAPSIQSRKEFPETSLHRALSLASALLMQIASSAAQVQFRGHKWWQWIRLEHSPGAIIYK